MSHHTLKDVYASVTTKIIAALETGTPPWVHPWRAGAGSLCPANLSSGRRYRGINVLLLNMTAMERGYSLNRWLTFQQARALGGHVRKGEQGTEVVLYKLRERDGEKPDSGVQRRPDCRRTRSLASDHCRSSRVASL
jgi:antirestriction protein ArdC